MRVGGKVENGERLQEMVLEQLAELRTDVKQLVKDVAALKVKATGWGAIGGLVASAILSGLVIWMARG